MVVYYKLTKWTIKGLLDQIHLVPNAWSSWAHKILKHCQIMIIDGLLNVQFDSAHHTIIVGELS